MLIESCAGAPLAKRLEENLPAGSTERQILPGCARLASIDRPSESKNSIAAISRRCRIVKRDLFFRALTSDHAERVPGYSGSNRSDLIGILNVRKVIISYLGLSHNSCREANLSFMQMISEPFYPARQCRYALVATVSSALIPAMDEPCPTSVG